jgi:hypothetical protein
MLSDRNIREINAAIATEIQTAKRWSASDEDKAAAIDRALKLKQLLDPNPSPDELIEKLADAMSRPSATHVHVQSVTPGDMLVDAIRAFRR